MQQYLKLQGYFGCLMALLKRELLDVGCFRFKGLALQYQLSSTSFRYINRISVMFILANLKRVAICGLTIAYILLGVSSSFSQEYRSGEPIGAVNEAGVRVPMSTNVKVYGSFHFSESCTFDPERNLILAMNNGERGDGTENDGFVSLINPDGSVHTPKWIGVTRDGLELHHPLGSAIRNGVLYTVDVGYIRSFDLMTGRPLKSVAVPGSTILNGIAVTDDGTVYASNTRNPELIYKITADDEVSIFAEGAPLNVPNGVAIDTDGNVVVVNIDDNAVITYNLNGEVVKTEHA
ncbi:MAG: hypothetical protein CMD92_00220, partial [Gammaproteobacteria bacterium]|nr:hypothetical protein [Gammaproteobacteria bacterium]